MPQLGDIIREQRARLGLTQKQLAERLRVDPQSVSNWENSRVTPGGRTLRRLEHELQVALPSAEGRDGLELDALPQSKKWLYEFLLKLVELGASEAQIEATKDLLTSSSATVLYGSADGLDDAAALQFMRGLGEVILTEVRTRTRESRWIK
jgi:transcriptional regulator with XRE-family HTH domain